MAVRKTLDGTGRSIAKKQLSERGGPKQIPIEPPGKFRFNNLDFLNKEYQQSHLIYFVNIFPQCEKRFCFSPETNTIRYGFIRTT